MPVQVSRPASIFALETLPIFLKLAGKKVVIAGEGPGALWKAELLAATGAEVHIFAPQKAKSFATLNPLTGKIVPHERVWQKEDLIDAALAIGDLHEEAEIQAFLAATRAAGVITNIIDNPAYCAFQFGTIVNRSPIVIGISTGGAAPVLGQAIRARIEALLPASLAAWGQLAQKLRPLIHDRTSEHAPNHAMLKRFWAYFAQKALAFPAHEPQAEDEKALLQHREALLRPPSLAPPLGEPNAAKQGFVSLVGAGPGDPELLTLKAMRALQMADVILYDALISEEVLELARREATRICVGKKGHAPSCKQDDICALITQLASEGKHVVRLKGGDPGIFGRAAEEIAACQAAGLPFAIIPGISAAQGAAASLGLSLTERQVARRLQFITGHGVDGALPQDFDWLSLKDPRATTAIYMPRRTFKEFCARAMEAGLPAQIPAIAVFSATTRQEKRIAAPLNELAQKLEEAPENGAVLVMIGEVFAGLIQ